MKRLFVFVNSLCSICCSEMCGNIMSYCTNRSDHCAYWTTSLQCFPCTSRLSWNCGSHALISIWRSWQSPDNVSRFWLSQGLDSDRTMFLDFLLSQGHYIHQTIFQGLDSHRTFFVKKFQYELRGLQFWRVPLLLHSPFRLKVLEFGCVPHRSDQVTHGTF